MPRTTLILAVVSAVAFAVIYLGMVLPLSKPIPASTAAGTVIDRVFQGEHTVGNVGYGMKAGHQVRIGEQYLIDIRLDSGEIVRGTWPAPTIDNLPVGARVMVKLQRRVLLLFWKRTFVDDIQPTASEEGSADR